MGISHSYTLQLSLYGWRTPENQIRHFNEEDYMNIGQNILNSICLLEGDDETCTNMFGFTKETLISQMKLTQ